MVETVQDWVYDCLLLTVFTRKHELHQGRMIIGVVQLLGA